jgi:hypothetical protein
VEMVSEDVDDVVVVLAGPELDVMKNEKKM